MSSHTVRGDDAAAAHGLAAHLRIAGADRTTKWRHRLYDLIDTARFCERDPRMTVGNDGFPYFCLDVPPAGRPGTLRIAALIDAATTRGFGIVIAAPHAADPWTFSCGDLVSKRAFGSYELPRLGAPANARPLIRDVRRDPGDLSIGAPPATLLPRYVQPLLRRFFEQSLGIAEPAALAMLPTHAQATERLVFRLSRADFSAEHDLEAALAGVGWFLPRHTIVSVLEPEIVAGLERAFVPLLR